MLRCEGEHNTEVKEEERSKAGGKKPELRRACAKMSQKQKLRVQAMVPATDASTRSTRNYEARGPGWLISMGAAVSGNPRRGHLEQRKRYWPHLFRTVEIGSRTWQRLSLDREGWGA